MLEMISRQVFSEKATFLLEKNNQYSFDVNHTATKKKIIRIIEKKFMVRVLNVNIHRKGKKKPRKSKYGYTQKRKSRAIITLRKNATYFKKY